MLSGAGADLGAVFVVGDVSHPVDLVLDGPVSADPRGKLGWFGLVDVKVGDGVDGLGGEAFRLVEASAAADLQRLGGVREVDAGGDGQDLQGADLAAAVPAVVVTISVGDRLPGQAGELFVHWGWLPFTVRIQCAPRSAR